MSKLIRQFEYNVGPGPEFKAQSELADTPVAAPAVKYIAYYLPQFHRIAENDAWWGAGFTEWTNVTKALPRFQGHYQPRLPGDLGFYDLAVPDAIRRQVALARRAGIHGFCIHNYWFDGKTLLATPIDALLRHKDIDIRFCVNWANESWSRRWDGRDNEVLMAQSHAPGSLEGYAEYLLPFIDDERYITVDGRPLIMLYRPGKFPDIKAAVDEFRNAFARRGRKDPYLVMPQAFGDNDPRVMGMDAAAGFPPHNSGWSGRNMRKGLDLLDPAYSGTVVAYDEIARNALANMTDDFRLFPGVCPAWDNEARRPNAGFALAGASPAKYGRWLEAASRQVLTAPPEERLVFINAWNEWAEGAYLEPDRHFGFAYLVATRQALERVTDGGRLQDAPLVEATRHPLAAPSESRFNRVRNWLAAAGRRPS